MMKYHTFTQCHLARKRGCKCPFQCVSRFPNHYIEHSSVLSDTSKQEMSHELTKVRSWVYSSNSAVCSILFNLIIFIITNIFRLTLILELNLTRLIISTEVQKYRSVYFSVCKLQIHWTPKTWLTFHM